ncbi:hypothetical protein [Stenomitos frigidus]|uniref:hypothetical protein n=1 Tax=Stenomitos frigidus TaxID=1886765 RepID=UPI0015E71625|nr:hypothetical protein [Stenomitos frigidus]
MNTLCWPFPSDMIQILVIDDDPFIQLVLKKTLQSQGYDVIAALSGEDGIVQAKQHDPL